MPTTPHTRPDPNALLRSIQREQEREVKGKLKIFFGMCAGVGKTYEMLQAAQEARNKNIDVVAGYIEAHRRAETEALAAGIPVIPRKRVEYRGSVMEEMDLDAILARKPALVLVDELAHTNTYGSRHAKRYQDVQELLDQGISVYTTLNVQHLESRADAVAKITGAVVRETVPDSVFEQAEEVEIIDIPPDELRKRFSEGKVYVPEQSRQAVTHFFRKENLIALREMSLRITTERVEHQLRDYVQAGSSRGPWKSGQRLLVGVTPSRDSVRLIRWARRLAFSMHSSWVAVFVERSTPHSLGEREQFAKNIALARELGAEIVTTADHDPAEAIVRVAREQNATLIIVGKSEHRSFWRQSLVDRMIGLSTDIDVYVTNGEETSERPKLKRQGIGFHSAASQYAAVASIVAAAAAACFQFSHLIGYQTVSLILLLVNTLLPLRFGLGPVLLAAVMSVSVWNFFFIPPRFTFRIAQPQDMLMAFMYFAVAVVTGVLSARVRARERIVRSRETRAAALYALTKELSSAKNQDEVVEAAVSNIRKYFDAEVAVFVSALDGDFINTPHGASTFTPSDKELSVPAWVQWNEKPAGRFSDTLPFAEATYHPLSGPRYPLGVIGVKPKGGERLSIDQDALLQNFLRQISSALEREFLNDMAKQSIAVAESERLYTTLFNSISHEIRTPITALLGASDALADNAAHLTPEAQRELAEEIQSAAERLDNLVQNLLAMTRIESGVIQPKRDWTDLRDVVNAACGKLRQELASHCLSVDVAPTVPLLRIDFGLMEQVFINLLRNAAVHTPAGSAISVGASLEKRECVVVVADDGLGFPEESISKVFEKFYRVPGSRAGGIGLGLSIVQGFVRAHRGTISAENGPQGGAKFTLRLPIEGQPRNATEEADEQ